MNMSATAQTIQRLREKARDHDDIIDTATVALRELDPAELLPATLQKKREILEKIIEHSAAKAKPYHDLASRLEMLP